jgi:hypothetical protein
MGPANVSCLQNSAFNRKGELNGTHLLNSLSRAPFFGTGVVMRLRIHGDPRPG